VARIVEFQRAVFREAVMRRISRIAIEFVGVLLAGVLSFFVMLTNGLIRLFLWLCGVASGLLLIAALFSGAGWLFTGDGHAFRNMLGFLFEAAVPFAVIAAVTYCRWKLFDWLGAR
jgi:hypothetical protein